MRLNFLLCIFAITIFVGFFVIITNTALWYSPSEEAAATAEELLVPIATSSLPVRLRVPTLNINTNVQQVGKTKSGAMGVPNNFTDVAWYKYGTVPGQLGSAVIDGHVDNALALDGIFKHLDILTVGDDLYVDTASSTVLHFVVYRTEVYPYKELPIHEIFNTEDASYLNLITCSGSWIRAHKTYDMRLVVYTKLAK